MLVLSRKEGESIVISGGIRIEVERILKNRVVIGITAPKTTSVYRQEICRDSEGDKLSEFDCLKT